VPPSFKNMTIKAKVIASFAAVLAVTMALGLFAILRLADVNDQAADIRNNWLPSTRTLGELVERTPRKSLRRRVKVATKRGRPTRR